MDRSPTFLSSPPPRFLFFFLFRTFINPDELSPRRDSLLVSVELPFLFYPSGYTFPRTVVVARGRTSASERFSLVNCDFIL